MENNFEDLIKRFGVPKVIIPNTPSIVYNNGDYHIVGENPEAEIDPQNRIYYRRFKYGESEFLAVKSRIETDLSRENLLLEDLENRNLKPIEFIYSSKKIWTPDYSQEIKYSSKVAIATDSDVAPISRAELLKAAEQERLLWVYDWSSMGDAYLHCCHCSAEFLPDTKNISGIHFLFDAPHQIPSAMLVGIGENFDRGDDLWDYCAREYFYRVFL